MKGVSLLSLRSGYEVYLLEAAYKDPAGCAARNVHGFTLDDISKMAEKWEDAPSLYLQLDAQSLFHGDDLNEQSIKEVDMDTDDATFDGDDKHQSQDAETVMMPGLKSLDYSGDDGLITVGDRWAAEEDDEEDLTGVKELHSSKWSKELDEDADNSDDAEKNSNALSGLMQAYSKTEKSVHWGDKISRSGFSIGAMKKRSISSLVIGPGSGYNIKSNPIKKEEDVVDTSGGSNPNESKRRFNEQLRAERESFKAVFDRRRRHRIGGLLDADDE